MTALFPVASAACALVAAPVASRTTWAQVADHHACFKIKDSTAKTLYTADLASEQAALAALSGCKIQLPAKLLCLGVRTETVAPVPPGSVDGPAASPQLCYKLKCASQGTMTVDDRFGTHVVEVKSGKFLCAPAAVSPSTTTTVPITTTTVAVVTTSTTLPAGCGNGVVDPPEQCDDGGNVSGDGCSAACEVEPAATAFRVTSLRLISPRIVVDVPFGGCQDVTDNSPTAFGSAVGDSVNFTLAKELLPTSAGGSYSRHLVSLLRPLDPTASVTLLAVHTDPSCDEATTPDTCGPTASPTFVHNAGNLQAGTCYTPVAADVNTRAGTPSAYTPSANTVSAPCFISDDGALALDLLSLVIPLQQARVTATYSGDPAAQLVSGVIEGFLPETAAADLIFPAGLPLIGGQSLYSTLQAGNRTALDSAGMTVLDGCNVGGGTVEDDGDMLGGERGFWFFLNFTAEMVTWTGP